MNNHTVAALCAAFVSKTIRRWLALFLAIIAVQPTFATPSNFTNNWECYVAIRNSTNDGTGTIADPYDGSGTKFSHLLYAMAGAYPSGTYYTNLTIHLAPGTYLADLGTIGSTVGLPLPLSSRIVGAGMNNTFVAVTNLSNGSASTCAFNTYLSGTNLTVVNDPFTFISDLTIDCGWANMSVERAQAVNINARNGGMERVRIINYGAEYANYPAFPVVWSLPSGGSNHVAIKDCVAEGSTLGASGARSTIFTIYNNATTNSTGILYGNQVLNAPDAVAFFAGSGCLLQANIANNIGVGYAFDTNASIISAQVTNIAIRGNSFLNAKSGIYIGSTYTNSGWDGVAISENLIEVNNSYSNSSVLLYDQYNAPSGIRVHGDAKNVTIKNNVIKTIPSLYGLSSGGYNVFIESSATAPTTNVVVDSNVFSEERGFSIGASAFNNTDYSSIARFSNNSGWRTRNIPLGGAHWCGPSSSDTNYTVIDAIWTSGLEDMVAVWMGGNTSSDHTIYIPTPASYFGHRLKLLVALTACVATHETIAVTGGGTSTTGTSASASGDYFFDSSVGLFSPAVYAWPTSLAGDCTTHTAVVELYSDGAYWHVRR
jgi:hypothetical protein